MPLYGGSSGSSGTPLSTCPIGTLTGQVNVYQNSYVWGGMVFAGDILIINSYTIYVYQTAAGNAQVAMYTTTDGNIVTNSTSAIGSCSSAGLLTMTLSTPITLTKGVSYYLACNCTANGSLFAAGTASSFNNPPKPAWTATSSSGVFPSTLGTLNGSASVVWIQANT
jgi:hypothetical protein